MIRCLPEGFDMPTRQTCYGGSRSSSFCLAVLLAAVVTSIPFHDSAASAAPSNPAPAPTKTETLSASAQPSSQYRAGIPVQQPLESGAADVDILRAELYEQGKIVAGLQQRIEATESKANRVQGYLNWLFAGGVAIGAWGFIRSERRTSQLHEIAVAGETASQGRVEQAHATLLDASQKTLNLVNDTLALAKEASNRATETMKHKAEEGLREVDTAAREQIGRIHASRKFKSTIEESSIRKEILKIAGDLATREGYILAQDVKLTPACYFIKGVKAYDEGHSHSAEAAFRRAADTSDATAGALALFWRGYVFNNIGDFRQAVECFTRALDSQEAGSAWHLDLRRILIETQFFADAKGLRPDVALVTDVVRHVEAELTKLEAEVGRRRALAVPASVTGRLKQLRGNVNVWAHTQTLEETFLIEAEAAFAHKESTEDLWTLFGRASSRAVLGREVTTSEWSRVAEMCRRELISRGEPRHLALLTLTRLYVTSYSREHARDAGEAMDQLRAHFEDTDDSEWLYSQRQKRNVPRDEFMNEAEDVFAKAKTLLDEAATNGHDA